MRVGRRRVRVDTVVEATGGVAVPVSFGWHPYWRMPVHATTGRYASPTSRTRASTGGACPPVARGVEPAAARPLRGQAFDDLYAFAGDRTAALHDGERSLRLALDGGYPFVQVFAPDGRAFCCLEPMTAPTNTLVTGDHPTVRPGARFVASFTATVGVRR